MARPVGLSNPKYDSGLFISQEEFNNFLKLPKTLAPSLLLGGLRIADFQDLQGYFREFCFLESSSFVERDALRVVGRHLCCATWSVFG